MRNAVGILQKTSDSKQLDGKRNPLFLIEETGTHYLVAIDMAGLPADHPRIRVRKDSLSITSGPSENQSSEQAIFELHSATKTKSTIYREGLLWLALPKYGLSEIQLAALDAGEI